MHTPSNVQYHLMPGTTSEILEDGSLMKMGQLAPHNDSVSYLFSIYIFAEDDPYDIKEAIYFRTVLTPNDYIRMSAEELEIYLNHQWEEMRTCYNQGAFIDENTGIQMMTTRVTSWTQMDLDIPAENYIRYIMAG